MSAAARPWAATSPSAPARQVPISPTPSQTPLPRVFWLLWAGALVNRLGDFVQPFLAIYLTLERHLAPAEVGSILSLWGLGQLGAGPLGGLMADRLGRRRALLWANGLGAAGMLALGAARARWQIALATLLLGFLGSLYRPPQQAAIADLTDESNRQRAFGVVYWAVNLGFACSVIAAGELSRFGFAWLFVADALTTLGYGFVIWAFVPETRPAPAAAAPARPLLVDLLAPLRDPKLLGFLGLCFASALAFCQVGGMLSLDLGRHGIGPARFGQLMAINGLLIVALQLPALTWANRLSRPRLMALSSVLIGVGFGLNGVVHLAPGYALGIAIWTVGEILQMPLLSAIVADLAPRDRRGAYQGAPSTLFALAGCLAPLLGGLVLERFGSRALWGGLWLLCLGSAVGHLWTGAAAEVSGDNAVLPC